MTELNLVLADISLAISCVEKWTSPQYVAKDPINKFNTAFVQPEPYGLVLIISPWNYPLLLSLQPLVGVIAAGNLIHTTGYAMYLIGDAGYNSTFDLPLYCTIYCAY